jgi:two-component system, NarL family, nitrate/nitrite response regulator NarL
VGNPHQNQAEAVKSAAGKDPDQSGIPARILVAGGDLLAGALASALETHGFATRHIALRESEIARGMEWRPNLLVLDARGLAVDTGSMLIGQMRQIGSQTCVIDTADQGDRSIAWMKAGASALVDGGEPFDKLFRTINRLLRIGRVTPVERASKPSLALTAAARRSKDPALWRFEDLTEREQVVLAELMDGHCAEEIATAAFVSISTVRSQIKAILNKLGVNSQLAAVALARRAGWSLDDHVSRSSKPSSGRRARNY